MPEEPPLVSADMQEGQLLGGQWGVRGEGVLGNRHGEAGGAGPGLGREGGAASGSCPCAKVNSVFVNAAPRLGCHRTQQK